MDKNRLNVVRGVCVWVGGEFEKKTKVLQEMKSEISVWIINWLYKTRQILNIVYVKEEYIEKLFIMFMDTPKLQPISKSKPKPSEQKVPSNNNNSSSTTTNSTTAAGNGLQSGGGGGSGGGCQVSGNSHTNHNPFGGNKTFGTSSNNDNKAATGSAAGVSGAE